MSYLYVYPYFWGDSLYKSLCLVSCASFCLLSVSLIIIEPVSEYYICIMSGPMFGYFVFCQSFVFAIRSQPQVYNSVLLFLPSPLVSLTRLSMTLSAVWNLLFFRFVAPPFCISSKLTGIHISMLGFVTALFPLGLIIVVCAGYELNIQNMRGVRCISNLLNKLYSKMNTNISNTHNCYSCFCHLHTNVHSPSHFPDTFNCVQ